jgi:hypothetical protein
MRPLAELQSCVVDALLAGDARSLSAALLGRTASRFDIHLRNYEASLVAALRDKFPACLWLIGPELFEAAARAFVRSHPPRRPCIAEYGAEWPRHLARFGRAAELPYLHSFAELEWAVGNVAIAVGAPPLSWDSVVRGGADQLLDARLALQPGLRYLHAPCRVDELIAIYLHDGAAPATFELDSSPAYLEIRGSRGEVAIAALDAAEHSFRAALADNHAIGEAAELALECDAAFNPGAALQRLARAGLVTLVHSVRPKETLHE